MIEILIQLPLWTTLRIYSNFSLQMRMFKSIYECLSEWQMKNSNSQLAIFRRKESDLNTYIPFILCTIVDNITGNWMCSSWMTEERINIIPAISNYCILLSEFHDQTWRFMWNFNKKHFIYFGARWSRNSVAFTANYWLVLQLAKLWAIVLILLITLGIILRFFIIVDWVRYVRNILEFVYLDSISLASATPLHFH